MDRNATGLKPPPGAKPLPASGAFARPVRADRELLEAVLARIDEDLARIPADPAAAQRRFVAAPSALRAPSERAERAPVGVRHEPGARALGTDGALAAAVADVAGRPLAVRHEIEVAGKAARRVWRFDRPVTAAEAPGKLYVSTPQGEVLWDGAPTQVLIEVLPEAAGRPIKRRFEARFDGVRAWIEPKA